MPSLLIVSYSFPPHAVVGGKRALRMATHLSAFGWRTQILAAREGCFEYSDPTSLDGAPPFTVIRTHSFEPKRWLRRLRAALGGTPAPPARSDGGSGSSGPMSWRPAERLTRARDTLFSLPDEWAGWLPVASPAGLWRAELPLPPAATEYEAGATMPEMDRLLRGVLAAPRRNPH
jgi:hypothetical protein